jgi:hypothetical protein
MKIKQIIFGILLFFIFYLEPIYIGPIKFAHLWKIPLLLYLLFSINFKIKKDKITQYSFLYYIKYLLTTGIIYFGYLMDGFLMTVRGISIPIINNFLNVKNYEQQKLVKFLSFISDFIIISSIPFLVNLIQPLGSGYELENYGLESVNGYVGIFQNAHGAAIITSQALLIKLFFVIKNKRFSIFNILLTAIGFFALYQTYVRTGYVMIFIGFLIIVYLEYGIKRFYKLIPVLGLLVIVAVYLFINDSALRGRVTQQNIYRQNQELTIDQISSGRLTLSIVNLQSYWESDILTKIFGMGVQYSTDEMNKKIGMRKMSHNGFVDALVHNGLFGFIFYILFLRMIFKIIKKNKHSVFYSLGLASFFSFLLFIFFQGGNFFLLEVQLLIILWILKE